MERIVDLERIQEGALQTLSDMDGWDELDKKTDKKKTTFFSLKEGESTVIRFIDKGPSVRWTHWLVKAKRTVTCLGEGCPVCEYRNSLSKEDAAKVAGNGRKCAFNVIDRADNTVKIFDQGVTVAKQLKEFVEEVGDITTYDIKVKRTSDGYVMFPQPVKPLSESDIELIADGKVDLKEHFKPYTYEQTEQLMHGVPADEVFKKQAEENFSLA